MLYIRSKSIWCIFALVQGQILFKIMSVETLNRSFSILRDLISIYFCETHCNIISYSIGNIKDINGSYSKTFSTSHKDAVRKE